MPSPAHDATDPEMKLRLSTMCMPPKSSIKSRLALSRSTVRADGSRPAALCTPSTILKRAFLLISILGQKSANWRDRRGDQSFERINRRPRCPQRKSTSSPSSAPPQPEADAPVTHAGTAPICPPPNTERIAGDRRRRTIAADYRSRHPHSFEPSSYEGRPYSFTINCRNARSGPRYDPLFAMSAPLSFCAFALV